MSQRRLRVGLYVNDRNATTPRFVRCMQLWNMSFRAVWRDELAALKPGDVDVLLLHGGWYGIDRVPGQNQHEGVERHPEHDAAAAAVRAFVQAGGGVVGVCCGAFNVVWLGLIEADISRTPGAGMHQLEAVAPEHPICAGVVQRAEGRSDRAWRPVPVIRVNGPLLFPKHPDTMILSYDWEHRLGAVLAGSFGRGRAVAMSPHPERTEHDLGADIPGEPLMPCAGLLKNALEWAGGMRV